MPRPPCIVFDIGGTSIRAGVLTAGGRLLGAPLRLPTPNIWNTPGCPLRRVQLALVDRIVTLTRLLQRQHPQLRLRHVGISMAGPITARGVVRHSSCLWGRGGRQFPLRAQLQRRLPLRWTIVNDMTAAAAYYGALPAHQRHRWIAVITVSSGVGSKVFDTVRREVLLDPEGLSGELGHVRVDVAPTATRCECGAAGHVQALSSGRAAERLARQWARQRPTLFRRSRLWRLAQGRAGAVTTHHLAAAAQRGDAFALDVIRHITAPLARAISVLVGTVGVGRVIMIGGFALGVGRPYLRVLQDHLVRLGCYGRSAASIRALVCLGQRGDRHGLIGAGVLAQEAARG